MSVLQTMAAKDHLLKYRSRSAGAKGLVGTGSVGEGIYRS